MFAVVSCQIAVLSVVVCLWLCVCGYVFVIEFVVVCLWFCVSSCVCSCVFVVVLVVVCLWFCACGCVCGCVFVVVCLWLCVCGCVLSSRSGREHWARMVVVEVRQGTLGVEGRG